MKTHHPSRHPATQKNPLTFSTLAIALAITSVYTIPSIAAEQNLASSADGVQYFERSKSGIRKISKDLYVAFPPAGKVTPQREPNIDQQLLLQGKYPLGYVLEAGQNQFNLPFLPDTGHGEGAKGPRSKQRAVWNSRGGTVEDPAAWPFLRVNGIDSQSCYECHNTIGEYTPADAKTVAKVRKPGTQGGPAGAANTAFINDQFPEDLNQLLGTDPTTKAVLTKFARNPPHVFGTGYTQRLATEMSTELQAQAKAVELVAKANLNKKQTQALTTKGISFGTYSVTCKTTTTCSVDASGVIGVQQDLVVRPFQWGGIASSVRHFARDALDFHFSVQAVEKVGHKDCDLDGLVDEITVGNVSALTAYVTMFRPPYQEIPKGKEASVKAGEKLMTTIGCTSCHQSSLTIDNATLSIQTPPAVPDNAPCPTEVAQLSNSLETYSDSAKEASDRVERAFAQEPKVDAAVKAKGKNAPEKLYALVKPALHAPELVPANANYLIDLNLTGVAKNAVPAYVWPRLPAQGRAVVVPLFSDLKLHYMGKQLSDNYAQPTDNADYAAQPGVFVTRVLWGIGDTDPYMHDGRARTLTDAIKLHGVEGSEAKPVADKFAKLSAAQQQNILDFLGSLKLPIAEGVTAPEYAQQ